MRQWRSLVALHAAAPSCFPQPPSPSPCPSPPREEEELEYDKSPLRRAAQGGEKEESAVVRLVGCDGRVRAYRPPVTARELMQAHPRHLVCRADALLIGEKIPALAPGAELQPGQAYFLLPAHLFRSVLSFVSLASSLLLLLSTAASNNASGGGKGGGGGGKPHRPKFELQRTASGTLQIKFSDDFLVGDGDDEPAAAEAEKKETKPAVLRGDERLQREYEELVGYGKSRRWAPKLDPIQEVVVVAAASTEEEEDPASSSPTSTTPSSASSSSSSSERRRRKSRGGIPFLGRLGSRRRRDSSSSAVACSG